jgi:hypothetical protein
MLIAMDRRWSASCFCFALDFTDIKEITAMRKREVRGPHHRAVMLWRLAVGALLVL